MLYIKYLLRLENSFSPQVKNIDPLTALSIGSAIVGGIGSVIGASSSNATNQAISNKQMDWQTEENEKNRQFQTEMWQKQNEYNAPSNQRKLFVEGGYNPFVLEQNGSGSSAGSVGTPSMVGAPNMPNIKPINPLEGVSSVMNAVSLANQKASVDSSVELNKSNIIKNLASTYIDSYERLGQDGADKVMDKIAPFLKGLDLSGSRSEELFNESIRGYRLENARKELDNEFQSLENQWYDILSKDKHLLNSDTHKLNEDVHKQYVETLKKIKAEISEIYSRRDLNLQQKDNLIAERSGVIIENGLKGLDFQNKKELQQTIRDTTKESLRNLEADTELKYTRRKKEGSTGKIGPFEWHPTPDYNDYFPFHRK